MFNPMLSRSSFVGLVLIIAIRFKVWTTSWYKMCSDNFYTILLHEKQHLWEGWNQHIPNSSKCIIHIFVYHVSRSWIIYFYFWYCCWCHILAVMSNYITFINLVVRIYPYHTLNFMITYVHPKGHMCDWHDGQVMTRPLKCHPSHHNVWSYLSMPGLKLHHVSKRVLYISIAFLFIFEILPFSMAYGSLGCLFINPCISVDLPLDWLVSPGELFPISLMSPRHMWLYTGHYMSPSISGIAKQASSGRTMEVRLKLQFYRRNYLFSSRCHLCY